DGDGDRGDERRSDERPHRRVPAGLGRAPDERIALERRPKPNVVLSGDGSGRARELQVAERAHRTRDVVTLIGWIRGPRERPARPRCATRSRIWRAVSDVESFTERP